MTKNPSPGSPWRMIVVPGWYVRSWTWGRRSAIRSGGSARKMGTELSRSASDRTCSLLRLAKYSLVVAKLRRKPPRSFTIWLSTTKATQPSKQPVASA